MLSFKLISFFFLSCTHSSVDAEFQPTRIIHHVDDPPVLRNGNSGRTLGSEACNISTSISCQNINGRDCKDMLISHNKGCYSPQLTFTFKFCNNSSDESINLLPGKKTWGKIGANKVFELDEITIKPKACRQEKVTQQYNICQESFKASMNFSARSQPTGEYCWSFTKYEEKVNKTSDPPSVSPSITPSSNAPTESTTEENILTIFQGAMKDPFENEGKSKSRVTSIIMGTLGAIAGAVLVIAILLHQKRKHRKEEGKAIPASDFNDFRNNSVIDLEDNSPDLETSVQSWFPTLSFWNTQSYFTESTIDGLNTIKSKSSYSSSLDKHEGAVQTRTQTPESKHKNSNIESSTKSTNSMSNKTSDIYADSKPHFWSSKKYVIESTMDALESNGRSAVEQTDVKTQDTNRQDPQPVKESKMKSLTDDALTRGSTPPYANSTDTRDNTTKSEKRLVSQIKEYKSRKAETDAITENEDLVEVSLNENSFELPAVGVTSQRKPGKLSSDVTFGSQSTFAISRKEKVPARPSKKNRASFLPYKRTSTNTVLSVNSSITEPTIFF